MLPLTYLLGGSSSQDYGITKEKLANLRSCLQTHSLSHLSHRIVGYTYTLCTLPCYLLLWQTVKSRIWAQIGRFLLCDKWLNRIFLQPNYDSISDFLDKNATHGRKIPKKEAEYLARNRKSWPKADTSVSRNKALDADGFNYSFTKGTREYIGTVTNGEECILQGNKSDVMLTIPSGLHGSVTGHIHTHTQDILKQIPDGECLIAPVPDYTANVEGKRSNKQMYKIKIRHCVKQKQDLKNIRVRTGDIHNNIRFTDIPRKTFFKRKSSSFHSAQCYKVDSKYIKIYTPHFCQFLCTLCEEECKGELQALLFGSHFLANESLVHVSKLYICGPLFSIRDFKKVCNSIGSKHFQ